MKLFALTALSLLLASPTLAQDAFTIRQSDMRVKLRVSLPSGSPALVTAFDGELSSVAAEGRKIGITARIADRARSLVEIRFWNLTPGRNGAEMIALAETAEAKMGEIVTASAESVRAVLTSVEIVEIITAPVVASADAGACPAVGGKCCVTCGGTTVCSYCAVFHDCGSCCSCGCC